MDGESFEVVIAEEHDWYLELVDRKFLFARAIGVAPEPLAEALPQKTDFLIGMVQQHWFQVIPWNFDSLEVSTNLESRLRPEVIETMDKLYRMAVAARSSFLSKSTINGSSQIRMASHRLHGRKARFIQEMLPLGKERN